MSGLYQRRRRRPEMNLLPLIDVLVMLIFFAFVTMQFRSASTLNISVPKVETAGRNEFSGKITIGVDKDGGLTFNGKAVAPGELAGLLEEVKKVNKDTPVLVRADEVTQFKRVTEVWDSCRKMGLNKVVMQVRQ
ncbi:MAG TPA: biopolymer transporter ExbD [Opitutaceae bacterium]|jgi:biopolymer transport protein ExbD|nr:biopolymer transporter ExbD [Opitutaceae bacterium]HRE05360.1 biopolymer transporter ExbD [Opitutaceae bacterium]